MSSLRGLITFTATAACELTRPDYEKHTWQHYECLKSECARILLDAVVKKGKQLHKLYHRINCIEKFGPVFWQWMPIHSQLKAFLKRTRCPRPQMTQMRNLSRPNQAKHFHWL